MGNQLKSTFLLFLDAFNLNFALAMLIALMTGLRLLWKHRQRSE